MTHRQQPLSALSPEEQERQRRAHEQPGPHGTPEVSMDEPILQFFDFRHLPSELQAVSAPFSDMASNIVATLPRNPERTVALRKLLEAKDAAVRAKLYVP